LEEGRYTFKSIAERDKWLNEHFPKRYPDDQELYPGRFRCGEWLLKLRGNGITVLVIHWGRNDESLH